ncbi:fructose-bisphosphate aldolase, class II [Piromyces finnis]|uniref:Fructose-bisphosphate aldolase n=1 Tax=Piromyces finnis TaxID=1754191 RepID=A0A1Y1VF92_9FUNG|nr:fructose-bisphosphate aldolase, class II [Piromyces finnis]|eukprot:ORX54718.1 fructose-bisphosphate aldolase, class II [Piromyces finnis]
MEKYITKTFKSYTVLRSYSTFVNKSKKLLDIIKPGVVVGNDLYKLYNYAKDNGFAIPAVNCTSSSTVNATLEAAKELKAPIIIQFSNGGSAFYAGKGLNNKNQEAATIGAISGALHVRQVAKSYGIPVILHSDHCARKLLPWMDGMIKADNEYFEIHGEPLFSSHMFDLSEENKEDNIKTCISYFKKMAKINQFIEMEIGITGGEEDGVDNTNAKNSSLYTKPEDIWDVYREFSKVSPFFTIAAAFGNVHGVYKPGNVVLRPDLLGKHQEYIRNKINSKEKNPVSFVFHGGSGSTKQEIQTALQNGIVKMNIDTDTQWAYWSGVNNFYNKKKDYLQNQIGNPEGNDKPNKKYYDPRSWLREGEKSMVERIKEACINLNNVNIL